MFSLDLLPVDEPAASPAHPEAASHHFPAQTHALPTRLLGSQIVFLVRASLVLSAGYVCEEVFAAIKIQSDSIFSLFTLFFLFPSQSAQPTLCHVGQVAHFTAAKISFSQVRKANFSRKRHSY